MPQYRPRVLDDMVSTILGQYLQGDNSYEADFYQYYSHAR